MKKIHILIGLILIASTGCKSQTILPLKEYYDGDRISNTYFKDIENSLDPFVGTWKFEDAASNTLIEIKLRKIEMYQTQDIYFDLIIGEYRYVKNGIEIINTLQNFSTNFTSQLSSHSISIDNEMNFGERPICNECDELFTRFKGLISDPIHNTVGTMYICRTTINSQPTIFVKIIGHSSGYVISTEPMDITSYNSTFDGPKGEFTLTKLPN